MRLLKWGLFALLFVPSVAFGAGFAKQSLFLSKSPVTDGDVVLVHAVVQNDATTKFDGELIFSVKKTGDTKEQIGTVAVAMPPGGATAASVSWKPAAGAQTVVAALTQKGGTVVEEESATFTINAKPKPTQTTAEGGVPPEAVIQPSTEVEATIIKFVPALSGVSGPIFSTIDSLRNKAGGFIDQGINWSKNKVAGKVAGQVLSASTSKENTTPSGILGTVLFFFAMISLYALSIFKWLIANTGVFYPFIAIVFLFLLWKLLSRFRRPNY